MCTLTYLLTENGYELFFNRDEQRSRISAQAPQFDSQLKSLYPIDRQGKGTWLAVDQYGMSLALLNNYPLETDDHLSPVNQRIYSSRGNIILSLLKLQKKANSPITLKIIIEYFNLKYLSQYKPFKLFVFLNELANEKDSVNVLNWNGERLTVEIITEKNLPITSSSFNFEKVLLSRQHTFRNLCNEKSLSSSQLKGFHFSTAKDSAMSVNMMREDARTVSISHIVINENITFNYFDNLLNRSETQTINRVFPAS